MSNVLIVGGAGYVGGAITDMLLEAPNFNVRVYDLLVYEDAFRKNVSFARGDVRDIEALRPHLKWADTVIWLAALVGDGACQINPQLTKEINQDTVEWLSRNFDGRIIFMSTCSVYGAQNGLLDETSSTNPLSAYAATKLQAEKYLENKNAIIFRLGTLFGVGDLFSRIRMDLVVNVLVSKAYFNKKIHVFGGEQFRPLLHVKDVARSVIKVIDHKAVGIYNLAHKNAKILDLAKSIITHFPETQLETTDIPFQDTRNYQVSFEKAVEDFGFDTVFDLNLGIEEVHDLLKQKRIKNFDDLRYSNANFLKENMERVIGGTNAFN